MSIKVTCVQCGTSLDVNDAMAGRRLRCPECDTAVHVPELEVPAETPPEAEPEPQPVQPVVVEAAPVPVAARGNPSPGDRR